MTHRSAAQALIVLATALTTSGAALAQTAPADPAPAPAPSLTGNISLTSNYKFRGQDQDMIGRNDYAKTKGFKPAIQGGFDYAFGDSGFYVGNWNSSVNWLKGNSIETDLYGGYKFKAGPVDLDVGALTYIYPGNSVGNTTELYIGATFATETIGSFTAKYSHTVSKDYFGYAGNKLGSGLKGQNTGYLNLAYSKEIVPKVTLKAAVGFTNMSSDIRSLGYKSYVDYNVGASYDFGNGLSLTGSVQGANKKTNYQVVANPGLEIPDFGTFSPTYYSPNKARFILTLTKTL
ncbi:TorF family putative porin [Variovorax sp. ZS18.2.2]|uniref:TorF family putative porin n=1 Tax=Variovorax sp. ZS18.2.2 TaxID=2971255 RepID=UPI002151514E|nr:TorF family putative porin [Variovorax sp. ZS18.2.2]MCR6480402.1 TorF family putative porin [Variovorax sp. ZS18.2.2]